MLVKVGTEEIDCPDAEQIGPRTREWDEIISRAGSLEERLALLGAALEEAFNAGVASGALRFAEVMADEIRERQGREETRAYLEGRGEGVEVGGGRAFLPGPARGASEPDNPPGSSEAPGGLPGGGEKGPGRERGN